MKFTGADFLDNMDSILNEAMDTGETVEVESNGEVLQMAVCEISLEGEDRPRRIAGASEELCLSDEERRAREEYPGAFWIEGV